MAQVLHERDHLARELLRGARHLAPHDLDLLLEVGIVDPVVEAAALERVVDLARAVRGDDHDRRRGGADGAELRDRDLEVREQLEQERLELLVGAVELVDEEDRRRLARRPVDRLEQRPAQQEVAGEDVVLVARRGFAARFEQADLEDLARVVPLVDRALEVEALVALQPDQRPIEHGRQHLGDLGLADAGLALEKERLAEAQGEEHGGGEAAIRHVVRGPQPLRDLVDRRRQRAIGVTRAGLPCSGRAIPRQLERAPAEHLGQVDAVLARGEDVAERIAGRQVAVDRGIDRGVVERLAGEGAAHALRVQRSGGDAVEAEARALALAVLDANDRRRAAPPRSPTPDART